MSLENCFKNFNFTKEDEREIRRSVRKNNFSEEDGVQQYISTLDTDKEILRDQLFDDGFDVSLRTEIPSTLILDEELLDEETSLLSLADALGTDPFDTSLFQATKRRRVEDVVNTFKKKGEPDRVGSPYPVTINPSKGDMRRLLKKASSEPGRAEGVDGTIRYIIHPDTGELHIWDGYLATHNQVEDFFGVSVKENQVGSIWLDDSGQLAAGVGLMAGRGFKGKIDIDELVRVDPADPSILKQATPVDPEAPKGVFAINKDRDQRIITLFEGANASTFLHEMSHSYLELLRDLEGQPGTEGLNDDIAVIVKHLGISSLSEVTNKEQEIFAETWEKYLYTGKSPTKELDSAFDKLRRWMTGIYMDIRVIGFSGVQITPEISEVMDRMLATEEEISAVEVEGQYAAQLLDLDIGLSDVEIERLTALQNKAREEARERMIKSLMQDITKKNTEKFKEEVEREKGNVEDEMKDIPVWKAVAYLRDGEVIGTDETADPIIKLNRDQVIALIGDRVTSLPGGNTRFGITRKKGGVDVETAAASFGFNSGIEMLEAILDTGTLEGNQQVYLSIDKVIEKEATGRVQAKRGEDLNPERIRAEAIAAVTNDDLGEVLLMELNLLRRMGGAEAVRMGAERQVAEEGAGTAAERTEDVAVERLILEEQPQDANVAELLSAEAKRSIAVSQRRAEKAAARQGREATNISQAVVRELARRRVNQLTMDEMGRLAHFSQDALRASKRVEAAIGKRDFDAARQHKWQQIWNHFMFIEAKKAESKQKAVFKRLSRYKNIKNFRKSAIDNTFIQKIQLLLDARNIGPGRMTSEVARQALEDLETWADHRNETMGDQIVIPLSVLDATDISQTTHQELLDLDTAVTSLNKNGRDNSADAKKQLKQFIRDLATGMELNAKKFKSRQEFEEIGQKVEDAADFYFGGTRKISHLMRELDGFEDLGPLREAIFRPIQDAASVELTMRLKAHAALTEVWGIMTGKLSRGERNKKFSIGDRMVKKDQILALALNWGNEHNRDAILNGARPWTEEQVFASFEHLDDAEWDFVEATWKFIGSYWNDIAALEEEMTGVPSPKVEAEPFTLPSGRVISGGYYPIAFDSKRSDKANRDAETLAKSGELMSGTWSRAATVHGHTKARSGSRNKAVKLDTDVIFRHIDQVIHDLAFRKAVIEVNAIISSDIFRTSLRKIKGIHAPGYVDGWLRHVAGGELVEAAPQDPALRHARIGMSIAEMGFSIRTFLVQPFGMTQSVARLGPGRMAAGVRDFYRAPFENMRDIIAKSPVMATRESNWDRNLADANRKLRPDNKTDTLRNASFYLIAKADLSVAFPTWMAAYRQGTDEKNFNEADAVAYADSVVEETQGSGSPKDLAAIQRGGEGRKLWTSFYTFFAAYQQMLTDAVKITQKKAGEEGLGKATAYGAGQFFWLVFAPGLATAWALDGGPDDDEAWWQWAGKELAKYSLGGLVGIREIANAAFGDYGFSGPASMKVLGELATTLNQVQQGELDKALIRSVLMTGGYIGHLPGRQTWRLVEAYMDFLDGQDEIEVGATVMGDIYTMMTGEHAHDR